MNQKPVRVLVVDDSPTARMSLRMAFAQDPRITVVGEAASMTEALKMADALRPDLITMDVCLHGDDGIETTRRLMGDVPTPILIVTSLDTKDETLVYRAMAAGALDVVGKPPSPTKSTYGTACKHLSMLATTLAEVPVVTRWARPSRATEQVSIHSRRELPSPDTETRGSSPSTPHKGTIRARIATDIDLVVMGASTGGPPLLLDILRGLPRPMRVSVVIVQHMTPGFGEGFARWLGVESGRSVVTVVDEIRPAPDTVYVAADDRHIVMTEAGNLRSISAEPVAYLRPSIDVFFDSVARTMGNRVIGVLLSGMGSDGASGLRALKVAGASTLAQEPSSCAVAGMPNAAIQLGGVDLVLSPDGIVRELSRFLTRLTEVS